MYLQAVQLSLQLVILFFQVIYDSLVLRNMLLHCAGILAHMGLDLLGSVSILQSVHCMVVLNAGRRHGCNHGGPRAA